MCVCVCVCVCVSPKGKDRPKLLGSVSQSYRVLNLPKGADTAKPVWLPFYETTETVRFGVCVCVCLCVWACMCGLRLSLVCVCVCVCVCVSPKGKDRPKLLGSVSQSYRVLNLPKGADTAKPV